MTSRFIHTILFAALAASSALATAQNLVVSGSTTVEKRFFNQPASLQGATGVAIKFVPVGSGAGLVDLAEGKAGVAASSESLADTIEGAQKVAKDASKPFTTPAGLQFHEIARDRIVAIVHPSNPVKSLTLDQLRELNTGKTANWKSVGGMDQGVLVVTSSLGSATRSVFQKQVLGGAAYASGVMEMAQTEQEISVVSKDKGAIGAVSESFAKAHAGKVRIIDSPDIGRPLGLITIGAPSHEAGKLIEHLRKTSMASR